MARRPHVVPTPEHEHRRAVAAQKVALLRSLSALLVERAWGPAAPGWCEARDELVHQFDLQADRITRDRLL